MKACLARDPEGKLIRKAGIMGIVIATGTIGPGDTIMVELPPLPHRQMGPV